LSPFGLLDALLCPPPDPARVSWLASVTYAHRGLHGAGLIENSPSAFAAAMERGMGIECDVQRSRDGQAMVFHDWELDRLTGETGPVKARGSEELGKVALTGSEDTIPTLSQLLAQVGGRTPLLIEIKSRREVPYEPLCRAVRDALGGYRGSVAAMSFDPRAVRWFALQAPALVRGLVVSEEHATSMQRHYALSRARPDFLACDIRDLPSRFATAQRARGLPILTWTVKDHALLARALKYADAPIAEGEGLASAGGSA